MPIMDATPAQVTHPTTEQLDAGLDAVAASPSDGGTVEMIVRRPTIGEREVLDAADLIVGEGLAGDNYLARGSRDGPADPEAQLNIMNSRSLDLCALGDRDRWQLAGDQLLVDLDLSVDNVPTGTQLAIGSAVIEVSAKPHTGCAKFRERFGTDAARWVNSRKDLRLRGINATVVQAGTVRRGDVIRKLP
jgi:hypothetical protein